MLDILLQTSLKIIMHHANTFHNFALCPCVKYEAFVTAKLGD